MSAFIFDVDGTLAETEELHRDAFNEAFGKANLSWHWDTYRYKELLTVSGGKERIRYFIDENEVKPTMPVDELIQQLHLAKTDIYGAGVREGRLELRAGVASLVSEAKRRGIRLAIATTTSPENVEHLLATAFGGSGDFEVIAAGDMVPNKKPAPDIYTLVLEKLGLPAADCIAFEDSANGLRSAKAAGLKCVVTPSHYSRDDDFDGADLVLDDLNNQKAIFALL